MQTNLSVTGKDYQAGSYTDFSDLARLRHEANTSPDSAMQKVARQFESLFINMMLKSMREASFGDPIFDSHQSGLYRDMFDNQVALNMAEGRGIGLADALMVQLGRYVPETQQGTVENQSVEIPQQTHSLTALPEVVLKQNIADESPQLKATRLQVTALQQPVFTPLSDEAVKGKVLPQAARDNPFAAPESFVQQLWPMAEKAAREIGVKPEALVAQAALETGWGQAVIRHADGSSSHNLFNIKADARWDGESVRKITLEYRDGVANREHARFRAYDSYEDSFRDYARFIRNNPRYQGALNVAHDAEQYITELHQAGYATDPDYASKVIDIMKRNVFDTATAVKHNEREG